MLPKRRKRVSKKGLGLSRELELSFLCDLGMEKGRACLAGL